MRFSTVVASARALLLRAVHPLREPAAIWRLGLFCAFAAIATVALVRLLGPLFRDMQALGVHDWDSHAGYRYIGVVALRTYHEWPWWDPWACGGFTAWGYAEGASQVVSPYALAYLLAPMPAALRVEMVGATLTALLGAYLLAGRFTKSIGLRAFVALGWALNARWAMQLAVGHTWHLQYAWLPIALWCFDHAREPGKLRWAVYAGATLALMSYMGAIYPLPHAALAIAIYAVVVAVAQKRWQPLVALVITGTSAIGFAAPKLFPVYINALRFPRVGESTEAIDLGQLLTMLVDETGTTGVSPVTVPVWEWHEYGLYGGFTTVLALGIGLLVGRGAPSLGLRALTLIFLLLGMGSFHAKAPWSLLHALPVFSSQHVPSRFLFPAVLFGLVALAAGFSRRVDPIVARHPWVDVALLAALLPFALGLATNGSKSTERAFSMRAAPIAAGRYFHHSVDSEGAYQTPGQRSAMLLGMYANAGVLRCYSVPFHEESGVIAKGAADYKGEAYFASGDGKAVVSRWSPSSAVVEFDGARPGDVLRYNMNYDPGWRANGRPGIEDAHVVAAKVDTTTGRVTFNFRPRGIDAGLATFAVTAFACFGLPALVRWKRSRRAAARR